MPLYPLSKIQAMAHRILEQANGCLTKIIDFIDLALGTSHRFQNDSLIVSGRNMLTWQIEPIYLGLFRCWWHLLTSLLFRKITLIYLDCTDCLRWGNVMLIYMSYHSLHVWIKMLWHLLNTRLFKCFSTLITLLWPRIFLIKLLWHWVVCHLLLERHVQISAIVLYDWIRLDVIILQSSRRRLHSKCSNISLMLLQCFFLVRAVHGHLLFFINNRKLIHGIGVIICVSDILCRNAFLNRISVPITITLRKAAIEVWIEILVADWRSRLSAWSQAIPLWNVVIFNLVWRLFGVHILDHLLVSDHRFFFVKFCGHLTVTWHHVCSVGVVLSAATLVSTCKYWWDFLPINNLAHFLRKILIVLVYNGRFTRWIGKIEWPPTNIIRWHFILHTHILRHFRKQFHIVGEWWHIFRIRHSLTLRLSQIVSVLLRHLLFDIWIWTLLHLRLGNIE